MNDLTGLVPGELERLTNLRRLSMSHNWVLSGTLPSPRLFPRLEHMNIMATRVCEPAAWGDLARPVGFLGRVCGETNTAVTVDVAVVYTPAARQALGGAAEVAALVDLVIAETNQALAAGDVRHRLRLVERSEVAYDETGDFRVDLTRLILSSDGHLDEVHALRDRVGADIVSLMVGESESCDAAGWAWHSRSPAGDAASRIRSDTSWDSATIGTTCTARNTGLRIRATATSTRPGSRRARRRPAAGAR